MFHNLYFEPDRAGQQFFFYQSNNISYSNIIREIFKRNYLLFPGIKPLESRRKRRNEGSMFHSGKERNISGNKDDT